ncbi:uncharacterized protein MYCFIDRAFT_179780 [Pseudocercospora fijiensis CIRAD86]|uniref:Uncharacterized protein n=1 Tax=Pseudocercospora fijiensis (strain CIRAD86) TaxID=383855 RepID=M3AK28_PSEFD|nr:uncharacterized protein MYCFIDRAFT_179780 [Pseudocercospora fijiensis CIRAD86]EME77528.1 hypothetical protein MYCFIDRAFT_179780 [Pseudocercospora fijiensis CIRAD86]
MKKRAGGGGGEIMSIGVGVSEASASSVQHAKPKLCLCWLQACFGEDAVMCSVISAATTLVSKFGLNRANVPLSTSKLLECMLASRRSDKLNLLRASRRAISQHLKNLLGKLRNIVHLFADAFANLESVPESFHQPSSLRPENIVSSHKEMHLGPSKTCLYPDRPRLVSQAKVAPQTLRDLFLFDHAAANLETLGNPSINRPRHRPEETGNFEREMRTGISPRSAALRLRSHTPRNRAPRVWGRQFLMIRKYGEIPSRDAFGAQQNVDSDRCPLQRRAWAGLGRAEPSGAERSRAEHASPISVSFDALQRAVSVGVDFPARVLPSAQNEEKPPPSFISRLSLHASVAAEVVVGRPFHLPPLHLLSVERHWSSVEDFISPAPLSAVSAQVLQNWSLVDNPISPEAVELLPHEGSILFSTPLPTLPFPQPIAYALRLILSPYSDRSSYPTLPFAIIPLTHYLSTHHPIYSPLPLSPSTIMSITTSSADKRPSPPSILPTRASPSTSCALPASTLKAPTSTRMPQASFPAEVNTQPSKPLAPVDVPVHACITTWHATAYSPKTYDFSVPIDAAQQSWSPRALVTSSRIPKTPSFYKAMHSNLAEPPASTTSTSVPTTAPATPAPAPVIEVQPDKFHTDTTEFICSFIEALPMQARAAAAAEDLSSPMAAFKEDAQKKNDRTGDPKARILNMEHESRLQRPAGAARRRDPRPESPQRLASIYATSPAFAANHSSYPGSHPAEKKSKDQHLLLALNIDSVLRSQFGMPMGSANHSGSLAPTPKPSGGVSVARACIVVILDRYTQPVQQQAKASSK